MGKEAIAKMKLAALIISVLLIVYAWINGYSSLTFQVHNTVKTVNEDNKRINNIEGQLKETRSDISWIKDGLNDLKKGQKENLNRILEALGK